VGGGKLVREGRASASHHRGGCRQDVFGSCSSKADIVEVISTSCFHGEYGFLKQIKGVSTSFRIDILCMAAVAGRSIVGIRVSRSVGDSARDLVTVDLGGSSKLWRRQ